MPRVVLKSVIYCDGDYGDCKSNEEALADLKLSSYDNRFYLDLKPALPEGWTLRISTSYYDGAEDSYLCPTCANPPPPPERKKRVPKKKKEV